MPGNNERRLVTAAEAVVSSLPDNDTHTVASAAMDTHGNVHTGVNVFHFTGGPCAELVTIAAAAAAAAGPLTTIVAVGNGGRGVIAPCGRCRQVLLDLHPDVAVIVPQASGDLTAEPIRYLLPHSYVPSTRPEVSRIVYFNPRYYDSVVSGRKTITVRYGEPIQAGSAVFLFEDGENNRRLTAQIESVKSRRFDQLSLDDALQEDLPDADALRRLLRKHYPDIGSQDLVYVARFHSVSV